MGTLLTNLDILCKTIPSAHTLLLTTGAGANIFASSYNIRTCKFLRLYSELYEEVFLNFLYFRIEMAWRRQRCGFHSTFQCMNYYSRTWIKEN